MPQNKSRHAPVWLIAPASALLLAVCAIYFSNQAGAQPNRAPEIISGAARVTNGDNIRIGDRRIRLWGIDAPAKDAECGRHQPGVDAREELRNLVDGEVVECTVKNRLRHGRVRATCTVRGHDIAQTLVERGWARDYPRYSCGAYAQAEAESRRRHRGIWGVSQCDAIWGDTNYAPERCPTRPAAQ